MWTLGVVEVATAAAVAARVAVAGAAAVAAVLGGETEVEAVDTCPRSTCRR